MAKRGPYRKGPFVIESGFVPSPDPDEKYVLEAIAEVDSGKSIGAAAHLIAKVHLRDETEEHEAERERLRSKIRRELTARLVRTKQP